MPYLFTLLCLLCVTSTQVSAEMMSYPVGQFSAGTLHGWTEKKFNGQTEYTLTTDISSQRNVLLATSHASASGLYFKQRIDLQKTPWLNWSWKTNTLLKDLDENSISGDDFVARIYIVLDGGLAFWKTRALNYVWSSSHQPHDFWPSPYTANSTMFAVESGDQNLGVWQYYKRNIRQDILTFLGKDVRYIDAVAIMADTDDSGLSASTAFGDIIFTSE